MKAIRYIQANDYLLIIVLYITMLGISWGENYNVIYGDADGYYMYLPATFISKDFHHLDGRSMNYKQNEKGEVVIKYTCGTAYFFLPFFLCAHLWNLYFHLPATGYGPTYNYAMIVCGVTWVFAGLALLKRLLKKYFTWAVTWTVLMAIVFGTNLYFYTIYAMTMSHVYSFALVSAILLLTDTYYERPRMSYLVLLAFLLGWLTLVRPTNIALIIFIVLYRVASADDFKKRIQFIKGRWLAIVMVLPFFILPMLPQMAYWKEMFGRYVAYSYQEESFLYWKQPKILEVLFDTQNGLFIYAPVLLFMVYGLFAGRKERRTSVYGTILVFAVITYIFASWSAWWFGGAYGHRCYIEYLPVFAFPLGIAFDKIFNARKGYVRWSFSVVIVLCLYYNVALTSIYKKELSWDGPKWRWNWGAWGEKVNHIYSKF